MKHSNAFSVKLTYTCHCRKDETHFGLHVKSRYFCPILTKFRVSRQIFIKFSIMLIHADRRADGWSSHDETNRRISRLNANAPKILTLINDFFPHSIDSNINVPGSSRKVHGCFSILTKSGFSRRYFVKVRTDRRTDRHDEINFMLFIRCMFLHEYFIQYVHSVIQRSFYFSILRFHSLLNWGTEHRLACCLIYLC